MAQVFSIPDGADFLSSLADALLDGQLVAGLTRDSDPFDLAAATIYLPTQRAARALAALLRERLGGAALLPRIAPLGMLEPPVEALAPGDVQDALADPLLAPAIGTVRRRMLLTELVLAWTRTLPGAIVSADGDGLRHDESQSLLVANTPGAAWGLAGQLADLIDEMTIEGVAWEKLDRLGEGDHDPYWRITLKFLEIARDYWPERLAEEGRMEAAVRRAALIEREVARLSQAAARQPVIAAGSTGTSRATQHLLAAIARAPRGAVVLPGLDTHLDDTSFAMIGAGVRDGLDTLASHPQAALSRLLPALGLARADVKEIGARDAARRARAALMSEALRPAETTDRWQGLSGDALERDGALADVHLVEAADEREEALAAACILRETLESPGRTAMLVTPDRGLARRVRAELRRWNVEVEDSAGEALALREPGMAARLVLNTLEHGFRPLALAALIAHPHLRFGLAPTAADILRRKIELGVLRGGPQHDLLADPDEEIARSREEKEGERIHATRRALREEDWQAVAAALHHLRSGFAPLRAMPARAPLGAWLAAHGESLASLMEAGPGDDPLAQDALAGTFDELTQSAPPDLILSLRDYAGFVDRVLRETLVPCGEGEHPRLRILGLLEARLMSADRVILGGLDETIWPPQTSTDAFLNRPMRAELGLTPPERRIGQTAHDFAAAMGAREVFLTRAARRQRQPTVASRFLQRLEAVAGKTHWEAMRARGEKWLSFARLLDTSPPVAPIARPAPVPPLDLRPRGLSVTRIETLRDNPYGIFAQRILRLDPLDPLEEAPDARERGLVLHAIVAEFAGGFEGALPDSSHAVLMDIAHRHVAPLRRDDTFQATQWPRMVRVLDFYWRWEKERRATLRLLVTEARGQCEIDLGDSIFTLSGIADRIEKHSDGSIVFVDFKTGNVPNKKNVETGLRPQLTLEAGILRHGAFEDFGKGHVAQSSGFRGDYIKLGGGEGGSETMIPLDDLIEDHWRLMREMLVHYRDPAAPYHAAPRGAPAHDDYEHLSRIREWSATGGLGNGEEGSA